MTATESERLDPGRVSVPERLEADAHKHFRRLAAFAVLLLVLAAVWAWSPARRWLDPEVLSAYFNGAEGTLWGPVVFTGLFVVASLLMVPLSVLIVVSILVFGPWIGASVSLVGGCASAGLGFWLGRSWMRDTVRERMGRRYEKLSAAFARGGVLSVLAVRIVPIAPYGVVNLVAGGTEVRVGHFLLGTLLGLLPGVIGLSFAADSVLEAVRAPNATTVVTATAIVLVTAVALHGIRRIIERRTQREPSA